MDEGKSVGLIIAAVLGCLGVLMCTGGVITGAGILVFYTASEPLVEEDPGVFTETEVAEPPKPAVDVPAGWEQYTHTKDCTSSNPGLVLTDFSFAHPPGHKFEICSPYNYVTLFQEDGSGKLTRQLGMGYLRGQESLYNKLVGDLIKNFEAGLPQGSRFENRSKDKYKTQGKSLVRRDEVLTLSSTVGNLADGRYAFRFILLPGPNNQGVSLILVERIDDESTKEAFDSMEGDYKIMIDSIRF